MFAFIKDQGLYLLLAAFLSSLITAGLVYWRRRYPRSTSIPYGGVAIFCGFWLSFFLCLPTQLFDSEQWMIFLATLVVLLTGMVDDYLELKPWQKSAGILAAANIIYFSTNIRFASNLLSGRGWLAVGLVYLLTMLWIYGVTNAMNLLDGVDGLASTVSATSLLTMAMTTFWFSSSIRLAFLMMLLLLAAAILGFLPFNWSPAKIYLGDTGALFIGFMYATLTVTNLKNASFYSLIVPVSFYVVPLFDTLYAMLRRIAKGQSILQGDREHLHHRLLAQGYSERQVVGLMTLVTLFFSGIAVMSHLFYSYRYYFLAVMVAVWVIALAWLLRRQHQQGDPTAADEVDRSH